MIQKCPSCGRRALRKRVKTDDYRCQSCGETCSSWDLPDEDDPDDGSGSIEDASDLDTEVLELLSDDPAEPVHDNRCPRCGRRALAPRVRTNDYRCSSCGRTFEQLEVTAHLLHAYEERLGRLYRRIALRAAPPAELNAGSASHGATFALLIGVLVGFALRFLGVCPWGWAIGAGVLVAVVASVMWTAIADSRAKRHADEGRLLWAKRNPALLNLITAINELPDPPSGASKLDAGRLAYRELSPELRELFAAAIATVASAPERRLYGQLHAELTSRLPPNSAAGPYRG